MGSEMQIIHYENTAISFSGMATLNKPGVKITPGPSAAVPVQSSHSWERGEWAAWEKRLCVSPGQGPAYWNNYIPQGLAIELHL